MPIRIRNKVNNASLNLATFHSCTSQFVPPTAGEASCWMGHEIQIIEATQAVASALGAGNSRTLEFRHGSTAEGSQLALTHPAINVRGTIGAVLPAGANSGFLESQILRQFDTGTPPSEASRIAWFYVDEESESRSWHGFGSATFNQSITTTPEYMGFEMNRSITTESVARHLICVPGTLGPVVVRYGTGGVGNDFELAVMVNGVATVIGTLTGSAANLLVFNVSIPIAAMDEVSFRIVRTLGASATMVIECVVGFTPTSP